MSIIHKSYIVGIILSLTIISFFTYTEISRHNSDSSDCIDNYLEKQINNTREAAIKFLDTKEETVFEHAVQLYKDDSLIFWQGTDFPVLQNEKFYKDSSFVITGTNETLFIDKTTLKNGYRMIAVVPLVNNGIIQGSRVLKPSCWKIHADNDIVNTSTSLEHYKLSIPGILIWLFILLVIVASSSFALTAYFHWFTNSSKKNVFTGIIFFLSLLILSIPTTFSPLFSGYWLTQPINLANAQGVNLLFLFTLFTLFLFLLASYQFKAGLKEQEKSAEVKKLVSIILAYLIIAASGVGIIYLIQSIHAASEVDFRLEKLYQTSVHEIAFLILYLLAFSLFFSFNQHVYKYISGANPLIWHKLSGVVSGLLVLILVFALGPVKLEIISLSLAFLIFIISLDLYQDKHSLNSTWTLTWMILIAAFLSLLLFNLDLQHDLDQRKSEIKNLIHSRDLEFETNLVNGLNDSNGVKYTRFLIQNNNNWIEEWQESMFKLNDSIWYSPLYGHYFKTYTSVSEPTSVGVFFMSKNVLLDSPQSILLNDQYALFFKDSLIFSHGLPINTKLSPKINSNSYLHQVSNGLSRLQYKTPDGFGILHSEKFPELLRPISLFSLLFFILSIFVFLVSLINTWVQFIPETLELKFFQKKSLRNRIQISIISLLISSFLVIGFVSQHYLKTMAEESSRLAQIEHSDVVKNRILRQLDQFSARSLEEQVSFMAVRELDLGRDEILIYNNNGSRINGLSQNKNNKDFRSLIPYPVFNTLASKSTDKIFYNEENQTKGVFFKIPFKGERILAFLPEKEKLSGGSRISDILATFLSIYTLLFILSGVIAIVLSNSITKPIEILGKKLRGLKLSKNNEPVQWKNEDEIGALIAIYNEMIQKLSDNAKVMAKVERDSAWKEMAKQVAHEIKNPLTPLKLNIQYLESKIRMNPEDAQGLISQITPGLIEQIDNLSQIASEFSNFAQLPSARNEKLRLNEIVKTVHDFFRKREDLDFQLFVPINDILVFADRNHLVRILNNVVKNAIQAIPPDREGEIILRLYTRGNDAIIQVTDNGSGIAVDMQDKVFSPNFTTKSSGTGLGLAISLNMLESFNGRIYFDTEENKGTDFYIEIPLMRLEDNYPDTKKVMLDD